MQFKHPEILYFLFLLIIPILVHLFQLRKFKKEFFTNVKFLRELSIQTRKSSKIKKYLLLATRLLLLAALIVAFAQPFFKAKDSVNATNELYIVLDNSFSMQAKGKKGELLKRAVQELLEHTPETTNFSLVTCSDNYWNTDIKSIKKELQDLKYSANPFQLDNLLAKIKAHKSAFNKDIVVITDGVGLQPNQLKGIKEDESLYFVFPEAEQTNNISIDSVYINQTLDKFYEIAIKLEAFGDDFEDTPIALYNQNKLIAKTLVNFKTTSQTIRFTIPKQDFHGYVSIADKGLDYDNTYYFSVSKPQKSNVISIGDTDKANFLSKIYTAEEFNFANFPLNGLDYNRIEKQDAIVLNEIKEIPQALQTTLKSFVEKGGNLVVIPSKDISVSTLNGFLSQFGAIQFKQYNESQKIISKINFNHPLYSTVFEKKVDNFQYPTVNGSFDLSSSAPLVLSYNDQSPFLTSVQKGIASVYVFAAPLNKMNGNFQNSPLIVPTFYNMAQSKQKSGVNAIIIGSNNPFIVETTLSKDEIVTVRNDKLGVKEDFIPVQQMLDNKVKLSFNDSPNEAGNFSVYNNKQKVENISFDYDRTESNVTHPNTDAASDYKEMNNIEQVFNTLYLDRTDNQIWKWFVFLSLIFIALEVLIQKFVK